MARYLIAHCKYGPLVRRRDECQDSSTVASAHELVHRDGSCLRLGLRGFNGPVEGIHGGAAVRLEPGPVGAHGQLDVGMSELLRHVVDIGAVL